MIRPLPIASLLLLVGCATEPSIEPSLAPRAAEAIDPRIPIPTSEPAGAPDAGLSSKLSALVATARAGQVEFDARAARAEPLAAAAGAEASESWIAAQQALSRLIEQQGVTAQVAADIDALAAQRIQSNGGMPAADQAAIQQAQAAVAAIASPQLSVIDRLKDRLAR